MIGVQRRAESNGCERKKKGAKATMPTRSAGAETKGAGGHEPVKERKNEQQDKSNTRKIWPLR